jgi:hypothetical protein
MTKDERETAKPAKASAAEARRERLAQELRANLLRRKAQRRLRREAEPAGDDEGQTSR